MTLIHDTTPADRNLDFLAVAHSAPALFFEGGIPPLLAQLQALRAEQAVSPLPLRITLFLTLLAPDFQEQELEVLYKGLLAEKDYEGCCACVGGILARIWENGRDLSGYDSWLDKAESLLDLSDDVPLLAVAFLLLQKGMAEMTGPGDLIRAEESYRRQHLTAERAGSIFLQVMGAAAHAYCHTWSGDLVKAELLLLEVAPLLDTPQLSPLCLAQYQITLSIVKTIQGEPLEAASILDRVLSHPLFVRASPALQLLALNHLLDSQVVSGNLAEMEKTTGHIRMLAVQEQNNFHRSYLNFCLGMAALAVGRPHKALVHGEEAALRAELGRSAIALRMSALLKGQALADLGRNRRALRHLAEWDHRWRKSGYRLIATLGLLETAAIYARGGEFEKARDAWQQAHILLPAGEKMYHLYRSKDFYHGLRERLLPSQTPAASVCDHPVRIRTLGSFSLEINGHRFYDRNWQGRQTKNLLKALIVHGGQKVSAERIAALLWPDADGDMAANSLNVTLSRLRKVGVRNGEKIRWLVSRNRRISLFANLCCVDALFFREKMEAALMKGDIVQIQEALSVYQGNFLAQDIDLGWIEPFRAQLLEWYSRGVLAVTDHHAAAGRLIEALPLLEQAIGFDPCNETLYLNLMRSYLLAGNRGKALEIYERAVKILSSELGLSPGAALQALAREAREQA